ncbi:MAG: alkaline phosphatase D family protein [Polyangiaceae bacterium]|jgi:alkaline phosphatase D|nr:alkaline phosphatase D family protein [Polyangiaceae bacterium]
MKHLRRSFLGKAAILGSSGALGLAGCGDDETTPEPEQDPIFQHGVASGDALVDAVILWTRVTAELEQVTVTWEIAEDEAFSTLVASGEVTTDADVDFTVKVDVTGLTPATSYYYRFAAEGEESVVGRTRTLPEGSPERGRIVVVSCSSYAHGYFHAYRRLAELDDIDAVVHLGDYIYEYGDGEYGDIRSYDPPHEIVTLEDYRRRYAHYRKDEHLQAAHQRHVFYTVWDDHEFANNAWKDGAENHDEATEGPFAERRTAAARAYSEWMPIRTDDPLKIFRKFQYGDLFELFMCDTRMWGRDEQAADKDDPAILDPERTLLGDDQETWLFDGLVGSTARWKLVGQQVMMAVLPLQALVNTDQWDGYTPARERFYTVLTATPVNDVIVLTGDIHTSWASDLTPDGVAYDPATGDGSVAVELVVPAISSPGLGELFAEVGSEIELDHPRFKLVDLVKRGYVVLDLTPQRAEASYVFFDQVEAEEAEELPPRKVVVLAGENRMTAG